VSLLDAAREAPAIPGLVKRATAALAAFVALVDGWSRQASRSVEEILGHVLSESGYQQHLTDSDSEEDQERLANIEELLTVAREFDEQHPDDGGLEAFLEQVCLVNDTDAWEADDDRVTLMTLHASKGLEFPVIYLTALEDGLIPHERSRERPEQLEEERRLLFVGITRAQEELRLSRAQYREFRGQRRMTIPSQFLMELPFDEIESFDIGGSSFVAEPAGRSYTWEDDDWRQDEPADDAAPVEVAQPAEGPATPASAAAGKGSRFGKVRLATAAEMAGAAAAAPPVNPEVFAQGMAVRHPEYGLGKIVALAGSGPRRTATVVFPSVGQKKFMLQQSPLRPVR
jgi:DNA helicase-2/ATP-dependent DNA helicase PcrA